MQYMLLIYEDESLYGSAGKVGPTLQEIVARRMAFNRVRADLLRRAGSTQEAREAYEIAISLVSASAEPPVADSAEGSVEREPRAEAQGPPASGTRSSSDTMPPEAVFARRGAVSCRNRASTRPTI